MEKKIISKIELRHIPGDDKMDNLLQKSLDSIHGEMLKYVQNNNIKSLVMGVSGGIDSALVAVIASKVAEEAGIPLIGSFVKIESNSPEELSRALKLQSLFSNFSVTDLTQEYETLVSSSMWTNPIKDVKESDLQRKIRLGNIKARMRMMYFYNHAQMNKGLVLSTDNRTEELLGFFTIHGDHNDFGPIQKLWKTEVYALADYIQFHMDDGDVKQSLIETIDADATDGLGITNSDLDQLTDIKFTSSQEGYEHVDNTLIAFLNNPLDLQDGKIIGRMLGTEFKREWPIVIPRGKIINSK